MKAYWFRFLDDSNNPTGWLGLVIGKTMHDIFWTIDEHGDPYRCQIMKATDGSFCVYKKLEDEDEGLDTWNKYEESESNPDPYEGTGWKTPIWPTREQNEI